MNKYPLIGVSICAVVLLVLSSLSNVVGYQSVKSTLVNDSPLFSMRTQRATNQQQNIITSEYLGKSKENIIFFPLKDKNIDLLRKCIIQLKTMDDNQIECLKNILSIELSRKGKMPDISPQVILSALYAIRDDPAVLMNLDNEFKSNDNYTNIPTSIPTYYCLCPSILEWNPSCIVHNMVHFILFLILAPFLVPLILLVWATAYLFSISGH